MERLLLLLVRLSPKRLLLRSWAALIVLSLLVHVPPLEGLAMAMGIGIFSGYPYVMMLGLPQGIVRPRVVVWARRLSIGFAVVLVLIAVLVPLVPKDYSPPTTPHAVSEWAAVLVALSANVVIFAPFFLGAAALNDLRRAADQDPTLESIPSFLGLYFGLFGGWLYVHRRVREALNVGEIDRPIANVHRP